MSRTAFEADRSVVKIYDLLYHSHSKSVALLLMGWVGLIELMEYMGEGFLIHSNTVIR